MNLFRDSDEAELNGSLDQFKLTRMEVYNWGTFVGLHRVEISPDGHLFMGMSGSGKSTLLDAHTALLVPKRWKSYNAAAVRDTDKRRADSTDLSYIRGAYGAGSTEDGGMVTKYLRTESTFSAISETYKNGRGTFVVLLQLLWVRGVTTADDDVQKRFLILTQPFDLKDIQFFHLADMEPRSIKTNLPQALIYPKDAFSSYMDRYCALLHIEEEVAVKLLHKAQSTKDLDNLGNFLRDYMLDPPQTFEIRDQLVQEFGDLSSAYQSVVDARQQRDQLLLIKDQFDLHTALGLRLSELATIGEGGRTYFDILRLGLFETNRGEAQREEHLAAHRLEGLEKSREQEDATRRVLAGRLEELGASQILQWKRDIAEAEKQKEKAIQKREQLERNCLFMTWALPGEEASLLALQDRAKSFLDSVDEVQLALGRERDEVVFSSKEKERAFRELSLEIQSMERRKSNIPGNLLDLRERVSRELRIPMNELPFAGELLEVPSEESRWRGAIERALGRFSRSLLVPEHHFAVVSGYLNNHHLGLKLNYLRLKPHRMVRDVSDPRSLVHKVRHKDGPLREWVTEELIERYDFACVDNTDELRQVAKGLTPQGTLKSSEIAHEKNDRSRIDDDGEWCLGFDAAQKLETYRARAQDLAQAILPLQKQRESFDSRLKQSTEQSNTCTLIVNSSWEEVDVASLVQQISDLEARIERVSRNVDVQQIRRQLEQLEVVIRDLDKEASDVRTRLATAKANKNRADEDISLLCDTGRPELDPVRTQSVVEYLTANGIPATTDRVSAVKGLEGRFFQGLSEAIDQVKERLVRTRSLISEDQRKFKDRWGQVAGDLVAEFEYVSEYFSLLEQILQDGLPRFEEKFRVLLAEQTDNNFAKLLTQLNDERREIRGRMTNVNEGLKLVPFNRRLNTYLVIEPKDAPDQRVRDFQQRLRDAMNNSLGGEQAEAELRFREMETLVKDLSSRDNLDWQKHVLDVRQHVIFRALEFDSLGIEVNAYDSGAGKSGGQRQLLSATVLAAALAYQMGGTERTPPVFSTVVLDEAFEKADSNFTHDALNIFKTLGFQLILATPGKHVETIQTFIGSASVISIRDLTASSAAPIEYLSAERRLDLPLDGVHG
jgi:uncharacterized protein YPO0396